MIIQDIRELLKNPNGPPESFTALCPYCEQPDNSLSVTLGDLGQILIKCHAGCPTLQILSSLNLGLLDICANPTKEITP